MNKRTRGPRQEEAKAFRLIRFRRRVVFGALLAAVLFFTSVPPGGGPFIAGLAAFFVVTAALQMSRCPRCDRRCFWKRWYWTNVLTTRCLHCGVRLYWSDAELSSARGASSVARSD
jgi:hypothetical protein